MNMDSLQQKIRNADLNINSSDMALLTSIEFTLQAQGSFLCMIFNRCSESCTHGCASTSCSQGLCAASSCATCMHGCSTGESKR